MCKSNTLRHCGAHTKAPAQTLMCARPFVPRLCVCLRVHMHTSLWIISRKETSFHRLLGRLYPGPVMLLTVIVCDRFNSSPARISFVFPALWARRRKGDELNQHNESGEWLLWEEVSKWQTSQRLHHEQHHRSRWMALSLKQWFACDL